MEAPDFGAMAWTLLDESAACEPLPIATCFAREDELIAAVGQGDLPPMLRLWRHPRALVLGYQDTRLPHWQAAADALAYAGWAVGVRTSGGQAVPLDAGVLNISLIYPDPARRVEAGFAAMHRLLGAALAPLGLGASRGLVTGGYCPGESDLAVQGRKVAGVAQRWRRGAGSVGAFLLVTGVGAERAALAERFYTLAGGVPGSPGHLAVTPAVMASLAEVVGSEAPAALSALMPQDVGARVWTALHTAFDP